MSTIGGWIIDNVKDARAGGRLAAGIPFAIWQRRD
jgi:hypothetical protein